MRYCFFSIIVLFLFSCSNETGNENKFTGIDVASLDSSVMPCDNFYLFANGTWLKNNPVPESETRWGSFNILRDKSNAILREILENAMRDTSAPQGSNTQKISDFYYCAMDASKLEQEGIKPLQAEFALIESIASFDDLLKVIAHHHKIGAAPLFAAEIEQDMKNNSQYALYLGQSGLGLPDRDFYFTKDSYTQKLLQQYEEHVSAMFQMLGNNNPEKQAKTIMHIETQLAAASMTLEDRRDPDIQYNKMSFDSLKQICAINWDLYNSEIGLKSPDYIIVAQPLFFKEIQNLSQKIPINDWKTYLQWHLIHHAANKLNRNFEKENFRFYGTILNGQQKEKPRWERVLRVINAELGEVLGQEFVKVVFSEESKRRVNEMVDNLLVAFEIRLKNLDWMGEETKKQALLKLSKITRKMGYPDRWRDYAALHIERDSYIMNFFRSNEFEFNRNLSKLGQPIDRGEWFMPPQTVNAYYNPLMNEIVFPAGILQPPFFNPNADDAVNYGGMGAVIGHELTHGFDDQGNKYDAEGNLNNWWTENDYKNFNAKAERVINQFNAYEALDSLFVKGKLTLGENIADLGGVSISFDAYRNSIKGKERFNINGFSPEQRFFIAYAQVWKGNQRDEALRQLVLTNPHSPENFRVIGPLSNNEEFYKVFGCTDGAVMVRADSIRAKIW